MDKYAHLTLPDRAHAVGCPTADGLEVTPDGKPVHGLERYEAQKPIVAMVRPDGTIGPGHETKVVVRCMDCGGDAVYGLDEIPPAPIGPDDGKDGSDG